MARKKQTSTKRFGPRYGRTLKEKVSRIETQQKSSYKCPKCHYVKVKRVTAGIWQCSKCDYKFTSKAYSVAKLPVLKNQDIQG